MSAARGHRDSVSIMRVEGGGKSESGADGIDGGGGGRAQCCRSDRAAAPVEGDEAEAGESPPDELGGRRQPHGEELIGNVMLVVRGGGSFRCVDS